jgi:hypothetical protein
LTDKPANGEPSVYQAFEVPVLDPSAEAAPNAAEMHSFENNINWSISIGEHSVTNQLRKQQVAG